MDAYEVRVLGYVRSPIADLADAPRQGDEVVVVTWLHLGDRTTLAVHPRGDTSRPVTGVFATRSPDRPNPIGLHRCRVLAVTGARLTVSGLEAVDGTPVVDVKIALGDVGDR